MRRLPYALTLVALMHIGTVVRADTLIGPQLPHKMPREKALALENADLKQQLMSLSWKLKIAELNLQVKAEEAETLKVKLQAVELNRQLLTEQDALKPALTERDSILKEFHVDLHDYGDRKVTIESASGEIKRQTERK